MFYNPNRAILFVVSLQDLSEFARTDNMDVGTSAIIQESTFLHSSGPAVLAIANIGSGNRVYQNPVFVQPSNIRRVLFVKTLPRRASARKFFAFNLQSVTHFLFG